MSGRCRQRLTTGRPAGDVATDAFVATRVAIAAPLGPGRVFELLEYLEFEVETRCLLSIAIRIRCSGGSGVFIWGRGTGEATLSSGGHATNTFALNYRVCNRLYQIINT